MRNPWLHYDPHGTKKWCHINTSLRAAKNPRLIHSGETLVVTRIDRLARSVHDLQLIVATLKAKGAHLFAAEQPVDSSTPVGKASFDMLGVVAEFEISLRRARQAEGNTAAKKRGAYTESPAKIDQS